MIQEVASQTAYPIADLALAQRLEQAEGAANAASVEARAHYDVTSAAESIRVGGVYAMFDGVGSPLTQTFGLGVLGPGTAEDLDELEAFFFDRGAPAFHEVSPLLSLDLLGRLTQRGYRPVELSNVLVRPTAVERPSDISTSLRVRLIEESEFDQWARITGRGWATESAEAAVFVEEFGRIMGRARGMHCFLAEIEGEPVAAAAFSCLGDVALLAGACTVPEARRKGAQRALLEERLRFAASQGASLAMIAAVPGSGSQRNAERSGFRVAYTRTKWMLEVPA